MEAKNSPTRALAEFIAELNYEQIPIGVVDHIKLCFLDTVGCGLFGSTLPWAQKVASFAEKMQGPPEATVWGQPFQLPAANAALVNGTAVHSFEIDDLHKTSILHPGGVAVTAGLAMAERVGRCHGKKLLTAVVAGYETGIRVGRSMGTAHLQKGFHPTGTNGTFAAGAAAGRLLGLDAATMTHVLGIAGTQAAGLMAAQYSAMVKRFHAGRAAQSGVYAALLAEQGFTGITDILEAEYGGYARVMGAGGDLSSITEDLGVSYATAQVGFKAYSAGGSTHTAHEAVKIIMHENQLTPADIDHILIRATTATVHHTSWEYVPKGATSAQMNMQYVVAVTVLDGQLFIDQFTEEKINDPQALAFTRKVTVQADPELDGLGPEFRHAIIAEIKTRQGGTYTRRVNTAKGSADNPMTRAEVIRKFSILAGKVLDSETITRLQKIVLHLEEVSDIGELTLLLRSSR
jgi:aconitate decarboxylase